MSLLNKHKTNYNRRLIVILTHICQKAFSAPSLSTSHTSTPIVSAEYEIARHTTPTPIVSAKYEIALILTTQQLPGGNTLFHNSTHVTFQQVGLLKYSAQLYLELYIFYIILCPVTILNCNNCFILLCTYTD